MADDRRRPILLVDDSLSDRQLALQELRTHGVTHEIVVVDDGVLALDYLYGTGRFAKPRPALPLVVLLDLGLPMIEGVEVLRRVRADLRTKTLPVVALASPDTMVDATRCTALGASAVLVKPLAFADFRAAMDRLGLATQVAMTEQHATLG